jgi:hypothetical protein
MQFAFKNLKVWQKAMTFAVNVIDAVERGSKGNFNFRPFSFQL